MDEQNTITQQEGVSSALETQQQDQNSQTVAGQKTAQAENETAVVQVTTQSETKTDTQTLPSTISFIVAVICGVILAFIILHWKKRLKLRIVTFEEVCQYARELKKQHPEATETMVSVVVNEKTHVTTLIQVLLKAERIPINEGDGKVAGRKFEILDVDSKLKELMGDDIKCFIPIE